MEGLKMDCDPCISSLLERVILTARMSATKEVCYVIAIVLRNVKSSIRPILYRGEEN